MSWEAGLRFAGQVWEITVPIGDGTLTAEDLRDLAVVFPATYERAYGEGTAWEGSEVLLANLTLRTVVPRRDPTLASPPAAVGDGQSSALKQERQVLLPGAATLAIVPVYEGDRFGEGLRINGPAVVDEHDTTLFVPPGWACERDGYSNYNLKRLR